MRKLLPIMALFTLGLASCHQEGPAERAGRNLDNAGLQVGDALNPPQGPAQSAGRKIDRERSGGAGSLAGPDVLCCVPFYASTEKTAGPRFVAHIFEAAAANRARDQPFRHGIPEAASARGS